MKILIIGGNVEALVANYILAERGHSPLMVVDRSKTQNAFVHGPWRPVGASPLLMEILDDLDMDFSDYQSEIGACGVEDMGPGVLDIRSAVERELQTTKLDHHPEFRAALTGRPARELTFDRQEFFDELAAVASLDTEALLVDSVGLQGRAPWALVGSRLLSLSFDLAIITAPPRIWDPGYEARDLTATEIERAPSSLLPFDLVELGGVAGFETLTWRNGNAVVETSGHGLPDLSELIRLAGGEASDASSEVASFEATGPGYRIGTSVRLRREIGDIGSLPPNAYALGRAATGEAQTLSQVAERVAEIIGD